MNKAPRYVPIVTGIFWAMVIPVFLGIYWPEGKLAFLRDILSVICTFVGVRSLWNGFFSREKKPTSDKKSIGVFQSAQFGAETRARLFFLIDKVEKEIGQWAIAYASDAQDMMIHPKLIEEIRKQPDKDILEPAIDLCFPTPAKKQRLNAKWSSSVKKYLAKPNTKNMLKNKSVALCAFIVNNLDVTTTLYVQLGHTPVLTEEKKYFARLEEAALWYRVIDELAYNLLGKEKRPIFIDSFADTLANILALQGISPNLIVKTFEDRMNEYGEYRHWIPEGGDGAKGTLFWEAAKHIGLAIGVTQDVIFSTSFGIRFMEVFIESLVNKLLTGKTKNSKKSL